MKLLVVEDERRLAGVLVDGLQEAGYIVDVAHDGEEQKDGHQVDRALRQAYRAHA